MLEGGDCSPVHDMSETWIGVESRKLRVLACKHDPAAALFRSDRKPIKRLRELVQSHVNDCDPVRAEVVSLPQFEQGVQNVGCSSFIPSLCESVR